MPFKKNYPDWRILITTGTVTSARLLATRLPAGVLHQYVPVDRRAYVRRFLDHWKPDLALWVESELWPHLLLELKNRATPTFLLNARLSEKSFGRWSMFGKSAQSILESLTGILAQTQEDARRFATLGGRGVVCAGNLKYAAQPLPADATTLAALRPLLATRPVWLMASTHAGEEDMAYKVAESLREKWPQLLTLIVPRHPQRGPDIAAQLEKQGAKVALRSQGALPDLGVDYYIADSMGELGVFFRLCPLVCMGGSFVWGGHNLVEPAQLGASILFGPRMTNFADMADAILLAKGAVQVQSPEGLARALDELLASPTQRALLGKAAKAFAESQGQVLTTTLETLAPFLRPPA